MPTECLTVLVTPQHQEQANPEVHGLRSVQTCPGLHHFFAFTWEPKLLVPILWTCPTCSFLEEMLNYPLLNIYYLGLYPKCKNEAFGRFYPERVRNKTHSGNNGVIKVTESREGLRPKARGQRPRRILCSKKNSLSHLHVHVQQ